MLKGVKSKTDLRECEGRKFGVEKFLLFNIRYKIADMTAHYNGTYNLLIPHFGIRLYTIIGHTLFSLL